jgi:Ribonuclease G/E
MSPVALLFMVDSGALPQQDANLDMAIVGVQFAALGIILVVVAWVLYEARKMRVEYTEQKSVFVRAVAIVNNSQQAQAQMISLLQRLESVSGDAQKADIRQLEERIDRLSELVEGLTQNSTAVVRKQHDPSVMRKGILGEDPKLRFSVLRDWAEKNSLAIIRRAALGWKNADDLIAMIPPALEPEAEILDDVALLLGTRGHSERLAIAIRDLTASK